MADVFKAGPQGVGFDIVDGLPEFLVVTNDVVVGFVEPDLAGLSGEFVQFVGGEGFPRMEDFFQFMTGLGSEDDMDMVRHHGPGTEFVAFAIEMAQGVFDDFGGGIFFEKARAHAGIEAVLDFFAEEKMESFVVFLGKILWRVGEPEFALLAEFGNFGFGEGIGETEGDGVGRPFEFPMVEVALGDLEFAELVEVDLWVCSTGVPPVSVIG